MNGTCLNCRNLNGCDLLVGPKGDFLADDIITEENFKICPQWTPVGTEEFDARQRAFSMAGVGAVRGIHRLNELISEDILKGGMDDMIDLKSIIKEGMSRAERTEQLMFLTDENGDFQTDQDGEKVPRGALPLREYAKDPDGPLGESPKKIIGWTSEQLLDAILDAEEAHGLIVPGRKTKKLKKEKNMPVFHGNPPTSTEKAAPAPTGQTAKISKPATGGRRSLLTKPSTQQTAPPEEPILPSKVGSSPKPAMTTSEKATTALSESAIENLAQKVINILMPLIKEEIEKVNNNIDYTRERNALNLTTLHDIIVTLKVNPDRLTEDSLLVPARGNIEEYLEPDSGGSEGN